MVRGIRLPDRLSVVDDVRNDDNLFVSGQQILLQHIHLERTEAAAELDLLRGRELLAGNDDDSVFIVGALDQTEGLIVETVRQIDTENPSTQTLTADYWLGLVHRGHA